jgi:hypothetical protein
MWVSGTRLTLPTMAPVDLSLSLIAYGIKRKEKKRKEKKEKKVN